MNITVRLFAMLKEQAGKGELELELAAGTSAREALTAAGVAAGISELLDRMPVALAVNREYANLDSVLVDGDELAVIPPVSGGAPEADLPQIHAAMTVEPLSADRLMSFVTHPRAGAIVTFQGMTRDVLRLEYEAFAEMAAERLAAILAAVAAEHDLIAIAAEHRTGAVPLSEASVIVAASAGHRPAAFAGARDAIDRIKSELPVWKREVTSADGVETTEWVAGTPVGKVAT
ncbi:MAG: molybdenum cofactor biosynthesis protein MoaE [Thermoleophilaceae bacterium]|nr:molybdenum cofactor biosynthesis protein MoaE [Thermoleophilaceae bacterium]